MHAHIFGDRSAATAFAKDIDTRESTLGSDSFERGTHQDRGLDESDARRDGSRTPNRARASACHDLKLPPSPRGAQLSGRRGRC